MKQPKQLSAIVVLSILWSTQVSAASVQSSQTLRAVTQPDGSITAEFEYTLLDNNSVQHITTETLINIPSGTNLDTLRASRHPAQLEIQENQETDNAFAELEQMSDHCDMLFSGPTTKATPGWQTWLTLAQKLGWHYWSQEDMQNLYPWEPCWTHGFFSNGDKSDVMNGISNPRVNELNSDMANVTNTITTLNAYSRRYDEDGMPIQ